MAFFHFMIKGIIGIMPAITYDANMTAAYNKTWDIVYAAFVVSKKLSSAKNAPNAMLAASTKMRMPPVVRIAGKPKPAEATPTTTPVVEIRLSSMP